jgi:hypothetical protein
MKCYIYAADCYCEKCGEALKQLLPKPKKPDDENTFDSDEYPKGPYSNGGGESDSPQHCGSGEECLDATIIDGEKHGCFLENDLTEDGQKSLQELHKDRNSPVTAFWIAHYKANGYDL